VANLAACVLSVTTKKGHQLFGEEKVHPWQRKSWLRLSS